MKIVLLSILVFLLAGCESLRTRNQVFKKQPGQVSQDEIESQPEQDEIVSEEPVEVKSKQVPRIGIIFGPGTVRTLAHSGVLDAFQQEKVPIESIIGLGWGALVAGYYASEGNVTQVQWQLSKLKKDDFVDKGLLSGKLQRKSVGGFIKKVLPAEVRSKKISQFKIPFSCPTTSYLVGNSVFKSSGTFEEVLKRCLPSPPVFAPEGVWVADINAIDESIRYLKQSGSNLIIYVNVLSSGDLFERSDIKEEPETALYWQQVRRSHSKISDLKLKYPQLRELKISVGRQQLLEVGNLRLLPLAGKRAGVELLKNLKAEFNF